MAWQTTISRLNSRRSDCTGLRFAALLAVTMLSGCSSALQWEEGVTPAVSNVPTASSSATRARHRAANKAVEMIGTPYRYGGSSPRGFDCSGLVQYSYSSAGLKVPRTSADQYSASVAISLTDAEPGDLLFFRYDQKISHVAIYLGDERFVHAPSSGKQVSVASLKDPHYQQHFVRVGRL
jgi:murein DD-endopeptidase